MSQKRSLASRNQVGCVGYSISVACSDKGPTLAARGWGQVDPVTPRDWPRLSIESGQFSFGDTAVIVAGTAPCFRRTAAIPERRTPIVQPARYSCIVGPNRCPIAGSDSPHDAAKRHVWGTRQSRHGQLPSAALLSVRSTRASGSGDQTPSSAVMCLLVVVLYVSVERSLLRVDTVISALPLAVNIV
jgi:hypothetical protein